MIAEQIDRYAVAYELVKNRHHWSGPIKSLIHEKDLEAIGGEMGLMAAVLTYTGRIPSLKPFDKDTFLVEAPPVIPNY